MPSPSAGPAPATGPDPAAAGAPGGPPRPRLLVVACALVLLEVLALVVAAVLGLLALVDGAHVGPVLMIVVMALGAAALLAGAARGLWRGMRWGRGPVITAQIMLVVVATTWWGTGAGPRALLPLAIAVVTAVALLTPQVVAVTLGGRRPPA